MYIVYSIHTCKPLGPSLVLCIYCMTTWCYIWSLEHCQHSKLAFLHLPSHTCWASQGLGHLCSQQHLAQWYPTMMKVEAFVVSKVEKVFGSTYRMSAVVWPCRLCSLNALPSVSGAGTGGTGDVLVDTLLVSSKSLPISHLNKAQSGVLDGSGSGLPALLECATTN